MRALCRSLRLLAGAPALLLMGGLGLGLLAEASSVGLLGLSGWFIASCFLAGRDPRSSFSYLAPSGGSAHSLWRASRRGTPNGWSPMPRRCGG